MTLALRKVVKPGPALIAVFDSVDQARSALAGLSDVGVAALELQPVEQAGTAARAHAQPCLLRIDVKPGQDPQRIIDLMRRSGARRVESRLSA
jgi:hypothetical protein